MRHIGPDLKRGTPSDLTCPTCHGGLRELRDLPMPAYRCRTGHQFTIDSLIQALEQDAEETLWTALRVLEEAVEAERKFAQTLRDRKEEESARGADALADRHLRQIESVRAAIEVE